MMPRVGMRWPCLVRIHCRWEYPKRVVFELFSELSCLLFPFLDLQIWARASTFSTLRGILLAPLRKFSISCLFKSEGASSWALRVGSADLVTFYVIFEALCSCRNFDRWCKCIKILREKVRQHVFGTMSDARVYCSCVQWVVGLY